MTTARNLMHRGARCVGENESVYTAARMMREMDVGSLPICGEDDRLHGMVTDRDIVMRCCAENRNPAEVKAAELAQGPPHWIDADTDVSQVLDLMEQHQVRRMPVIDNHRLVGMISESDLAKNLTDQQMAHFVETVYAVR